MFFVGTSGGPGRGLLAALLLTGVILLGVFLTFGVSRLLSGTLLRGVPSSFTLELPPYRRPRIGQVVVRSVLDRTLFVLGRAAAVAAPAGLLIWLCANVQVGGDSILNWCTGFLDPFARLLGLDGVILMAFLLGFPANEIVIPIIIMAYLSTGSLLEFDSLDALRQLLVDHGWPWDTTVAMGMVTDLGSRDMAMARSRPNRRHSSRMLPMAVTTPTVQPTSTGSQCLASSLRWE